MGFTIVELIVVVAVIAILVTISVVAYRGVQNMANDSATAAGVRNILEDLKVDNFAKTDPPGYDAMTARTNLSATGTAVYAFEGLTDFNDTATSGQKIISSQTYASEYSKKVAGRAGYISVTVNNGYTNQYYLAAMAVGVYTNKDAVPAANRPMKPSDQVVPNVTGWYMVAGTNMEIIGGKLVCANGSTPTSTLGATWANVNSGTYPRLRVPIVLNGKITLGAAIYYIERAPVSCPGAGGGIGDLFAVVDNTTVTDPVTSLVGFYPVEGSIKPYNR